MSGDNLKISQGQNMTTRDVDQICGQHKIFKVCSCHKPCGIFTKAAAYELQKKLDKKVLTFYIHPLQPIRFSSSKVTEQELNS